MARYHVNPETGEPGVCKASDGACRFADNAHHYDTPEDARAAFEESMVAEEFKKISFKPGEIQVEPLEQGLIDSHHAALPPGTYFVGDPCYSAGKDDKAWDDWVRVAGEESHGFTDPIAAATYNGYPVVGVNTMYGDGSYPGSDGFAYPVDAGMIGAVPQDLLEKMGVTAEQLNGLGTWHSTTSPLELSYSDDGTIMVGDIAILTGDEELDDAGEDALYGEEEWDEEQL